MPAPIPAALAEVQSPAQPPHAARSVFGNFKPASAPDQGADFGPAPRPDVDRTGVDASELPAPALQDAIDLAMARSFVYGFLARGFEYPAPATWEWLGSTEAQRALSLALAILVLPEESCIDDAPPAKPATSSIPRNPARSASVTDTAEARDARLFAAQLTPAAFEDFAADYIAVFGHAARGTCPINEIEYGDPKEDPLFQPHRLADLAGFFAAFGLELDPGSGERQDHLAVELEFLSFLAAKEAYALEHQLDTAELELGRTAQGAFLREHAGRWVPGFCRRLERVAQHPVLRGFARLTRLCVTADCRRQRVPAGADNLALRPVDTGALLCTSCGLQPRADGSE
jgi:TorA maturation chaperone TorD